MWECWRYMPYRQILRILTLSNQWSKTSVDFYVIVIPWVVCPPVRGDYPRALARLSYVQMDKHGITILYHLYQCRSFTSRDISWVV